MSSLDDMQRDDFATDEQVALYIHHMLSLLGRTGFMYERGRNGHMWLVLSAELPCDVVGEIAELVREYRYR